MRFVVSFFVTLLLSLSALAADSTFVAPYERYDTDELPPSVYAGRRAQLEQYLGNNNVAVFRSATEKTRSADVEYPFRQSNHLFYLTGSPQPKTALLIVPRGISLNGNQIKQFFFIENRNPSQETWTGRTMGVEEAKKIFTGGTVLAYNRLPEVLAKALTGADTFYNIGEELQLVHDDVSDTTISVATMFSASLKKRFPALVIKTVLRPLATMRMKKSPEELHLLQRAIDISCEAHRATITAGKAGMHEYELQAVMENIFTARGAESPGYPSIVGSGPNSCILHYSTNRRQTRSGDLVLMDCGAEYHGYSADVTRTFPISGKFSPAQKIIYNIVLAAHDSALVLTRAGNEFRAPHRRAFDVVTKELLKLGIISGDETAKKYFMHGTSHHLGLDVHDITDGSALAAGNVITIEPGIYIPEGSPCDRKWWNIGIRIEDDVLVTESRPIVLSDKAPARAEEIELLMRRKK